MNNKASNWRKCMDRIVDKVFGYLEGNDTSLPPVLYAQLMYAIHHEMAVKPTDFFIRRTGALLFDIATVMEWKEQVMTEMATIFGWTEDQRTRYAEELQQEILCATTAVEMYNEDSKMRVDQTVPFREQKILPALRNLKQLESIIE